MDNTTSKEPLKSSILLTPLGSMLAIANSKSLCFLSFSDQPFLKKKIKQLSIETGSAIINSSNDIIDVFTKELRAYFSGMTKEFSTPFYTPGTSFQRLAWETLSKLSYGETISYRKQAQSIRNPLTNRAIANANSANRLLIIIPCHRVICNNGNIGGYSGGLWRKIWLLEHEKRFKAFLS